MRGRRRAVSSFFTQRVSIEAFAVSFQEEKVKGRGRNTPSGNSEGTVLADAEAAALSVAELRPKGFAAVNEDRLNVPLVEGA